MLNCLSLVQIITLRKISCMHISFLACPLHLRLPTMRTTHMGPWMLLLISKHGSRRFTSWMWRTNAKEKSGLRLPSLRLARTQRTAEAEEETPPRTTTHPLPTHQQYYLTLPTLEPMQTPNKLSLQSYHRLNTTCYAHTV